jgi:hypothetical protein
VASIAGAGTGNTITQINPLTGDADSSVFIGSEPSRLALSDDGRTLYSKLDGTRAIRRYDVETKTAGLQFTPNASYQIQDMEVLPGSPQSLAVTIRYDGVAVYDNGVQRPTVGDGGAYALNTIEFSNSASTLYGYDNESSGFELVKLSIDNSGVKGVTSTNNLISGYAVDMKFSNGLLYATTGRVVDPEARRLIGTFQNGGNAIAVDALQNRVFFINDNVLTAYDASTFLKIGSVTLSGLTGTPTRMVRWGANGLAVRTLSNTSSGTSEGQLYLIQSHLVSATSLIPTGVQLGATTFSNYEGSQAIVATVTRTGDVSAASSVDYATADGTATANADYAPVSGTLNFAAGESSKTISVPIINDNVFESNESINLTIGNATAGNNLLFPNTAVLTIFDNDSQPNISAAGITVNEPPIGNINAADFTVRLSNPTMQTVTVAYSTADMTATAGSDYTATSGTLTFNPLETSKTVTVAVNGDNLSENDESFALRLTNATNSYVFSNQQIIAVIKNYNLQAQRAVPFDYDGDRKSDVSVFRPDGGVWYLLNSTRGFSALQFGISTDKLAPADYDGDGKTDIAVFRNGVWYLLRSSAGFVSASFGSPGDVPVSADYDGDGKAELALFRPSNGNWYTLNLVNNQFVTAQFGSQADIPVSADYDNDGKTDYAVYRPSNGVWYMLRSRDGFSAVQFGVSTDKPVVGDYDGDGQADQAVYRPAEGNWYLSKSTQGIAVIQFGVSTDFPVPADYDGDGRTDVAVYRPNSGTWFQMKSAQGFASVQFGTATDKPVMNAYLP